MTYLQWRSLGGLAVRPKIAAKSHKIMEGWRRRGSREGGFAAAEALHSNGMVCLSGVNPPPNTHIPHPSPNSTTDTTPRRGRGGVIGSSQPELDLFLNTKCGRGPEE